MRRWTALLTVLLFVAPALALTRAEELALAETEGLITEPVPSEEWREGLAERLINEGERFSPFALPEGLEVPAAPPGRTDYLHLDGSVSSTLDGGFHLAHALEGDGFAWHLNGGYGMRDNGGRPREELGGRLDFGIFLPSENRLFFNGEARRWSFEAADGIQQQEQFGGGLTGVWRQSDVVTTFARLSFKSLNQFGRGSFNFYNGDVELGSHLYLGSDDHLTARLFYRYAQGAAATNVGRLCASNTYTADRILFLTTGLGVAWAGEAFFEYDLAARLLLGPYSLFGLIGRQRVSFPAPAEDWWQLPGLSEVNALGANQSSDYYLEYSLHLGEGSVAGLRGGLGIASAPWEVALTDSGTLMARNGTYREFLKLGVHLDLGLDIFSLPARLRGDYEYADATPFWRSETGTPLPHHAAHTAQLEFSLQVTEWLITGLMVDYLGDREDGNGGRLSGNVLFSLSTQFQISELFSLSLRGNNLLDSPRETWAGAAEGPLSVELELAFNL
jgi:hypothetical protein